MRHCCIVVLSRTPSFRIFVIPIEGRVNLLLVLQDRFHCFTWGVPPKKQGAAILPVGMRPMGAGPGSRVSTMMRWLFSGLFPGVSSTDPIKQDGPRRRSRVIRWAQLVQGAAPPCRAVLRIPVPCALVLRARRASSYRAACLGAEYRQPEAPSR
jgi:hypothetical protein